MFIQLTKEFMGRKAGERIDVTETDGNALIEKGIANPVTDDLITPAVSKAIEGAFSKFTEGLQGIIDHSLKEFANAQAKSRKNAVPAIFGEGGEGDPKKNFGDFLLCVRRGDIKTLAEKYNSHYTAWEGEGQKAALTTQTGTQGGFTVPEEFYNQLQALVAEQSIVETRATKIPMGSNTIEVPLLDVVTAPAAGDTAFFGGLKAVWTEEAFALTQTEPTFKQVRLTAHELSGYSLMSNTVMNDSAIGLESLLRTLFAGAIAWYKDYAFLRGNGTGKPLGMLNAGALVSVTRSGANQFTLADAAGMLGRLLPGWSPKSTVWAVHPTLLTKMIQINASGTGSDLVWVDNSIREKPRMVLFGIPVEVTEKLPALGTLGDVLLLDCRHYLIGDRQQVEIAFSEHFRFTNNQGAWRFVSRCDGQPWLRSAVTLSDASSTLSPFVALAA